MRSPCTVLLALCAITSAFLLTGCSAQRLTRAELSALEADAAATIEDFKDADAGFSRWMDRSAGYAIFPSVGKGAIGIGGAHGDGLVYEDGAVIGTSAMSQATIGFQLGGQVFSEVIFFEDEADIDRFTTGKFEFGAQASAVAATAGAAAGTEFTNGMAIFLHSKGGLMYEASIGGQKFNFRPIEDAIRE